MFGLAECRESNEAEFLDMLNCLPPENWRTTDGVEHFRMCEYWEGTTTQQFARRGDQYRTKLIDVTDKSTWITAADFD